MSNQINIQPTELRIGNLLQKDGKVFAVTIDDLIKLSQGNTIGEPIEILQEYLVKFGFKEIENKWFEKHFFVNPHHEDRSTLNINSASFQIALFGDQMEEAVYLTPCKFIHKLQNLYFELTGTELNYEKLKL